MTFLDFINENSVGIGVSLTLISITLIITLAVIFSQILTQKYDKELPERQERFKLNQFKKGVEAANKIISNTEDQ